MLRHQNVSEDLEIQARAKLVEGLNEVLAEPLGVKKSRPAVSAGGKIVQMVEPVIMALT